MTYVADAGNLASERAGIEISLATTKRRLVRAYLQLTACTLRGPRLPRPSRSVLATASSTLAVIVALGLLGDTFTDSRTRDLAALLGLVVVLGAVPLRKLHFSAAVGAAVWLFVYVAFETIPDLVHIPTPVAAAAGGSAYYDSPYLPQQLAAVLVQSAIVAVVLTAAYIVRRRRPVAPRRLTAGGTAIARVPPSAGYPPRGRALVIGATALVAITLIPDLDSQIFESSLEPVAPSWDSANLLTWGAFVEQGLVPMKDFFYPYGGRWLYQPLPLGPVWFWLSQVAMLALGGWSLWRLTEGQVGRVAVCLGLVPLFGLSTTFHWRYLPALLMAMTYAAVGPGRHLRPIRDHLVFGIAVLLAALTELDLVLIGLAGIAFVVMGELVSGRLTGGVRRILRGLAVDALPLFLVVAVPLLWLLTDTTEGNTRFWLGLGGTSAASAASQELYGALVLFTWKPTPPAVSVALPALLLVAGIIHSVLSKERAPGVSQILLATAGASSVLELKHLVRPIPEAVVAIALVGLTWSAVLLWSRRAVITGAATGALVGALIVSFGKSSALTGYLTSAARSPMAAVGDIGLLFRGDEISRVDGQRFAPSRFSNWPEAALASDLREGMRSARDRTFAVLGDAQLLYTIFRQRPPYHIQLYDASKVDEQRAVVDALTRQRPAYMYWRRDFIQDAVPQHVRVPIIFSYAVQHYVPVRLGDPGDVLRRRDGDPIPIEYWRSRLGDTVDLGFVPASSRADEADPCAGGDGCVSYALLEGRPTRRGETANLLLSGRRGTFRVIIRARPGITTYPVRLDRLWFTRVLGSPPKLRTDTPNWTVRRLRVRTGDDLY